MSNTDEKKQGGSDQGNAIENETREAGSIEGDVDGEGRPVKRSETEPTVTEEDSKLAKEHGYGGESRGKKY